MSKAFVGNRVQNVDIGEEPKKITRVIIKVDSDHVYTAGNDSGRTIERECPWGSEEMARAVLDKLSGVSYQPFSAERAMLSPAFEIGDAVTVGGVYSQIVGADINYKVSGLVDIYAPDLDEAEDEYPSERTVQSSIQLQLAHARSVINKRVDELYLAVFGEEGSGAEASIKIQLDEITAKVEGALGTDKNGNLIPVSSSINLALGEITAKVEGALGTDDKGNLIPVSSSINLALGEITAKVEGALGTDDKGNLIPVSTSLDLALGEAEISVSNGSDSSTFTLTIGNAKIKSPEIKMTGVVTFSGLASGETTINGSWLETGTVKTDALHLEGMLTVYDGPDSDTPGGYIGFDDGFNNSSGIGMRRYAPDRYGNTQGPQVVCTDEAARISFTSVAGRNTSDTSVVCKANSLALTGDSLIQMAIGGNVLVDLDTDGFYSASSTLTLGTQDHKWSDVYAAGTSFSALVARVSALDGK